MWAVKSSVFDERVEMCASASLCLSLRYSRRVRSDGTRTVSSLFPEIDPDFQYL